MTFRKNLIPVLTPLVLLGWLAVFATAARSAPLPGDPAQPSPLPWPDSLTENCLGCHGNARWGIAARMARTPSAYAGHRSLDHPIGMPYGDYAAQFPGSYRHLTGLDPTIRLIDGRVVCISCHRLKQEHVAVRLDDAPGSDRGGCLASQELARDTRQNSLCLACHLL